MNEVKQSLQARFTSWWQSYEILNKGKMQIAQDAYSQGSSEFDAGCLLIAELESGRDNPVTTVPDGWKLVPVEPTMGMLEALMEWREVGNVNAYNNILDSAPTYIGDNAALNNK